MNTSQSAIARLESGRSRPSTRTLEKLAAATGSKLRIVLGAGGWGAGYLISVNLHGCDHD